MAKASKQKATKAAATVQYKVSGRVLNSNGEPIMGQEVLAADVDLRGAAIYRTVSTLQELKANKGFDLLGTSTTNADGYYEISFTKEMFQNNEIGLADVIVFAVDDGRFTARSKLADQADYNNNALSNWDFQLPDSTKRGVSEYTRLMQVIAPFVKQSQLQLYQLSGSADQVAFLASETSQDPGHTTLAVQADQLKNDCLQQNKSVKSTFISKDIQFFDELFYGIGRQDIALSWASIVMENAPDLQSAIQNSIAQNIISAQEDIVIEAFIAIVLHVAVERSVSAPETAGLYKTIGFTIKDATLQKTFAQTYLQFQDNSANFWNNLSQQTGFTGDIVTSLQLTNQLSILTLQHTALIEELQVNRAIKDPSDLLTLTTDNWNAIIQKLGVPDSVPGDTTAEKAANYVAGMQNMLNAAYPTQKIALMVAANQVQPGNTGINEKIAAFFSAAPGFDIGSSQITDPDFDTILKNVAGTLYSQTQQQIQLIQRVFQISPTPEVMATLIGKGYGSAHQIASLGQNAFIRQEATNLGGTAVALSVYNRARHQALRSQHTLLRMNDTQSKATPLKIITAGQQEAIGAYITNLDTSN